MHSFFHSPIQNHRSGLRQIKCSITGARLVDLLVDEKYMATREEAVDFGAHLMAIGLLKHGMRIKQKISLLLSVLPPSHPRSYLPPSLPFLPSHLPPPPFLPPSQSSPLSYLLLPSYLPLPSFLYMSL